MLKDYDYKILRYLVRVDCATVEQINAKFPKKKYDTPERLKTLRTLKPRLVSVLDTTYTSDGVLTWGDKYKITSYGRRVANDYKHERREKIKETLLRFRIPLIFSLLALLKSYSNELTWLWSQLVQIMK